MATLTGKLVADTYKALLKLIDNDILTASEKQISDGFGQGSNVFIDQNGFLRAAQFKVTGGTASQFLKGNGSLDNNTYYLASNPSGFLTAAVANTLYLPIGTTTSAIAEGSRLYFTTARVLATTLAGFVPISGTVTASDTILTSIEKIWYNIINGGGGGGGYVPYIGALQNLNLGTFGLISDFVQFNTTNSAIPTTAGTMAWNNTDGTADLKLKGGNVTLQIGQEQVVRVVNKTGGNLLEANYHAVYISGAQGQRLKVDLALAVTDGTSAGTLGLVTENINNNQEGFITSSGLVNEINTTGSLQGETWADGDILYLSPLVAGDITNVKPLAPEHTVIMGFVVYAHAIHGKIYVKVDNGYEIEELHDVQVITRTDTDILQWYEDDLVWRNIQFATALDNAGGIIGLGSINYVPRFDGTNSISNSLIFDDLENVIIGGTVGIIPNPFGVADMLTVLNGNIAIDGAYSYRIDTHQILKRTNATGEFRIGTDVIGDFTTLYAGTSERARLTAAGYLGLGVTSPASMIHAKDSTAYPKIIIDNTGLTGGGSFSARQNGTETAIFGISGAWQANTTSDAAIVATRAGQGIKFYTNGSATARGGIDSVANSFIGQLPAYYTGATNFIVQGISAAALIGITHADNSIKGVFSTLNSGVNIGSETPHPVIFRADDIESARIASDGKWLFGTVVNDNVNIVQVNGSLIATSLKKTGGTSGQFLKADGSVDTNTYYLASNPSNFIPLTAISTTAFGLTYTNTTGVISLTAGFEIPTTTDTTNWDIAYFNRITSATSPLSITSNVISISQASGSVNGFLSSTDWNTFNNKANALSGTLNYIPKFTSGSTIGNSLIYDNGATITVAGTVGLGLFNVQGSISTLLGLARGIHLSSTLVAGANGDVLVGLDVNPTFTIGAFTGVSKIAARFVGDFVSYKNTSSALGAGYGIEFGTNVLTPRIDFVVNGIYTGSFQASGTNVEFVNNLSSGTISFRIVDNKMRLFNTGNLILQNGGTFTDAGYRLDVVGTARVSGVLTLSSTITNGTYTYTLPSATGTFALTSALASYVPTTRSITINGTAFDLSADRTYSVGTVTSVSMTVPTGLSISGSPISTSGTLGLTLTAGYVIPTTASATTWDTAYNRSLTAIAVSGTTTKTLTLTKQDGTTLTASWSDINTDAVISVFGRTGAIVATSGDYTTAQVTESGNLYYTDARARGALSFVAGSGAYNSTTGVITIPTNNNQITNGSAYITLTAISATSPIVYNNITGVISMPVATTSVNGYLSSTDWNTFNNKSNTNGTVTSVSGTGTVSGLTLTGTVTTTGSLTLGGTLSLTSLNVTTALGFTPVTNARTLSINGTSYDLTADRSWTISGTIGGLTSGYIPKATSASTLGNSLIYDNGTNVGISNTSPESKFHIFDSTNLGGTAGNYLLLQTLQNVGGAGGNNLYERTWAYRTGTGTDWTTWSLWTGISVDVSFSTPTTSKTWHWRDPLADKQHFGSGSTNVMTIGASNVGIGTTSPSFKLDVNGTTRVSGVLTLSSTISNGTFIYTLPSATGTLALTSALSGYLPLTGGTLTGALGGTSATFSSSVTASSFIKSGGTSVQYLMADGSVSTLTNPITGTGTINELAFFNTASTIASLGVATYPSLTELSYVKGVTSAIQTQINTKQATISLTTTGTSGAATFSANTLNIPQYQSVLTNPITGTGTTNYVPKFTSGSAIGNSLIFDNGTNVLINTTTDSGYKLNVNGSITSTYLFVNGGFSGTLLKGGDLGSGSDVVRMLKNDNVVAMLVRGDGNVGINTASPSFRLDVNGTGNFSNTLTGTSATFSSSVTATSFNGTTNNIFNVSGTEKMRLNSSGNLGIGVTPSAWVAANGLQVQYATVSGRSTLPSFAEYAANIFTDSGVRKYIATDFGSSYTQYQSVHYWFTAPSGTAGTAITLSQAMTLFANGNLAINTPTDSGFKLNVVGTTKISGVLTLSSTISNGTFTYTLPSATGTLALTNDLSSYVPTSRTLTINGTSFDLSANRSFSVGTITGSGTTTYIPKWDGSTSLTNSQIFDNGSSVTVGSNVALYKFAVNPVSNSYFGVGFTGTNSIFVNAVDSGYTSIPIVNNAQSHSWAIGYSDAMLLNSSLNLLIGTTSGVSGGGKLQVNGDVNINGNFKINGTIIGGGGGSGITGSGSANMVPKWTSASAIADSALFDNGAYSMAIGTTSVSFPADRKGLVIRPNGANSGEILVQSTNNTNGSTDGLTFSNIYNEGGAIYQRANFHLRFGTNNLERLRISENGNLGFNTTNQFGGGVKVIGINNCSTAPTTNPSSGGVIYVESGALKYRGDLGTVTTIANA